MVWTSCVFDARIRAELPGKAQLLLQMHDEFIVEVEGAETAVLGQNA
jgi:hypothetical protein